MVAGLEMTTQYIGMKLQEATEKAKQAGFTVAVEVIGPQYLDCQYRPNQITFKVKDGVIVNANIG
jgi:hypothetical protein